MTVTEQLMKYKEMVDRWAKEYDDIADTVRGDNIALHHPNIFRSVVKLAIIVEKMALLRRVMGDLEGMANQEMEMEEPLSMDALREATRGLTELLDDPHPGLVTWNEFVVNKLKIIANYLER